MLGQSRVLQAYIIGSCNLQWRFFCRSIFNGSCVFFFSSASALNASARKTFACTFQAAFSSFLTGRPTLQPLTAESLNASVVEICPGTHESKPCTEARTYLWEPRNKVLISCFIDWTSLREKFYMYKHSKPYLSGIFANFSEKSQ